MATERTRKIMAGVKRRLTRAVNLHLVACGHEDAVTLAFRAEDQLLEFVEQELESLQKQASYAAAQPFAKV